MRIKVSLVTYVEIDDYMDDGITMPEDEAVKYALEHVGQGDFDVEVQHYEPLS